jgi:hypothetical protein
LTERGDILSQSVQAGGISRYDHPVSTVVPHSFRVGWSHSECSTYDINMLHTYLSDINVVAWPARSALGTTLSRPSTTQPSPFFILGIFVRIAESNHLYAAVTLYQ